MIREIVPAKERDMILDNMGLTPSFTTRAYVDNGTVSDADGEILVALKPNHAPTAKYVAQLREELPKRFPGCTFYFQPADITSQILDFGLPAPINVQVVGVDREGNLPVAKKLRDEMAKIPGIVDVHIHQITDYPTLRVDVDRVMISQMGTGLTQQSVTGSVLVSLSGTTQVTPNYWVNPQNRINYVLAVQTPPSRISTVDALMSTPIINGVTPTSPATTPSTFLAPLIPGTPGAGAPGLPIRGQQPYQQPQLLSNVSQLHRTTSEAVVSHYNVQSVFEVYADVQGRDLGGVSADVQRVVDSMQSDLPRGSSFAVRGQVQSMNNSFDGLAYGLMFAVLLVYYPDGRELPVVARPVHHPHRTARGLGRHHLDAVSDPHDDQCAGANGRDHVHRRGDLQQHPSGDIRQRPAAQGRRRPQRSTDGRRNPASAGHDDGTGHDDRHVADVARAGRWGRAECPARPGRHRRLAGCHDLHAFLRARHVQLAPAHAAPSRDGGGRDLIEAGTGMSAVRRF